MSELYIESRANQPRVFALNVNNDCALFTPGCILQSGEMKIKVTDELGVTKANTSYAVDTVAISLVYDNGKKKDIFLQLS